MEAAGALRAAAPNLGSILGGVVVIRTLLSDQTPILSSSTHQLSSITDFRIELAIESLPYPRINLVNPPLGKRLNP